LAEHSVIAGLCQAIHREIFPWIKAPLKTLSDMAGQSEPDGSPDANEEVRMQNAEVLGNAGGTPALRAKSKRIEQTKSKQKMTIIKSPRLVPPSRRVYRRGQRSALSLPAKADRQQFSARLEIAFVSAAVILMAEFFR
jgi:hypothetical protein